MSTSKHFNTISWVAIILSVAIVLGCFLFASPDAKAITMGYEDRLFDTSYVHTLDIVIDDWTGFLDTCESEEYSVCSVVIDGEAFRNVAIRGKGNTSLSSVSSMDSDRYSFKIEFDHYAKDNSYYGLDKLSLNNLIYDNTMMKDYLTYEMMREFGAKAPLCSFVYITVNGEDFGLYLAIEGVEESFLRRNYGNDYGELYKPDSMDFGGGRGNGQEFNMDDFAPEGGFDMNFEPPADFGNMAPGDFGNMAPGDFGDMAPPEGNFDPSALAPTDNPEGGDMGKGFGGFGGMGSSDVKLQYTDDDPNSYSTLFNSAKTDITGADQQRLIQALKTLSGSDPGAAVMVEDVIRYFVVHNYVVNGDSYTGSMIHNYYLYEADGKLTMLPWDYNLGFGTFQGGDGTTSVNDPIDTPLSTGSSDRPMIDWILENETYLALYHEYFAQFLSTVDMQKIIDQAYGLIAPYVEKDPTKFCSYEEFEAGVAALKSFCELRNESILGQLNGTIPATNAERSGSDALIDASTLDTSAMGSMGGGGGFRREGSQGEKADTQMPPTNPAPTDNAEAAPQRDFRQMSANRSEAAMPNQQILLIGSSVILLAGILFALFFKRRK